MNNKQKNKQIPIMVIGVSLFILLGAHLIAACMNFDGLNRTQRMGVALLASLEWWILVQLLTSIKLGYWFAEREEPDKHMRILKRRGMLTIVCAVAIMMMAFFMGDYAYALEPQVHIIVFVALAAMPLFLMLACFITRSKLSTALGGYPNEDISKAFLEQRELADKASKKTKLELAVNRRNAAIIAFMLAFSGAGCTYLAAMLLRSSPPLTLVALIYAQLLIVTGLNRIRFKLPNTFMDESEIYIQESEFPILYSLAKRAAEQVGCEVKLSLAILPRGTVGVADIGGRISLQIGAQLLSILSAEELTAIYRHEFSHVKANRGNIVYEYSNWNSMGRSVFPLCASLDKLFFSHLNIECAFLTELYRFGLSVREEEAADRAMLIGCDKSIPASALIKTDFYANFECESDSYDSPCELDGERIPADLATRKNAELLNRIGIRKDEWLRLIPLEILARNASHPTLKMRLDAMGVSTPETLPCCDSEAFALEKEKALRMADAYFEKELAELYESARKNALKTVGEWEDRGRPLVAEEYSDVIGALKDMGRIADAEELADRALKELHKAARAYACLFKGGLLAKRCDRAALPLLYEAIESGNYLEEGLEFIGNLCCRIGDQEELDKYRNIAQTRMKTHVNEYEKIGTIDKKSDLSEERLDEGELEAMLAHVMGIDRGMIDEIYLVHHRVSANMAASAVIVRFSSDCGNTERARIMHEIFNYLDTVSLRQYSLHIYEDVPKKKVAAVPNSLVYSRKRDAKGA